MKLSAVVLLCFAFILHSQNANGWNWVNEYDKPFEFLCPNGAAVSQIHSVHDNHREDRIFAISCRLTSRSHTLCHWSGMLNLSWNVSQLINDLVKTTIFECLVAVCWDYLRFPWPLLTFSPYLYSGVVLMVGDKESVFFRLGFCACKQRNPFALINKPKGFSQDWYLKI